MMLFVSLIISDASRDGIIDNVFLNEEERREALLEFYMDSFNDGGLPDEAWPLDEEAPIEDIITAIELHVGRAVVLKEWDL